MLAGCVKPMMDLSYIGVARCVEHECMESRSDEVTKRYRRCFVDQGEGETRVYGSGWERLEMIP